MKRNFFTLALIFTFLGGCLFEDQKEIIKENRIDVKQVKINYYADKSVNSLEVPPDLTSPDYENSFRIREFVKDIDANVVNLSNTNEIIEKNQKVLTVPTDIVIKGSGTRKWLIVEKDTETVWSLSKQFLRDYGFVIKKINKEIGVMETNYLENKPKIPASSMGWFRSALESTIDNVSYTLPSVDSYKIRIEPIEGGKKTEVHLSLNSMAEVITGSGKDETTLWQYKERDINLESEMLYNLMVYLGSDAANAREKIIEAQNESKLIIKNETDINGYAKLIFNFGLEATWDNIAWALNDLSLEIESKDVKEKAFYIKAARTSDKGIFTKMFGDDAVRQVFRVSLKSINETKTEVLFFDVSEKNENETKEFSFDLMKQIKDKFN